MKPRWSSTTPCSDPHISTIDCRWHPSHTSFSTSQCDLSNSAVYMPWIAVVADLPRGRPERLAPLWHRSTSCNLTCAPPLMCCVHTSNIVVRSRATSSICAGRTDAISLISSICTTTHLITVAWSTHNSRYYMSWTGLRSIRSSDEEILMM